MEQEAIFKAFAKRVNPTKVNRTVATSKEMNRNFQRGLSPSRKALAKSYDAIL